MNKLKFIVMGTVFGFTLVKSEAVSWFRIQEMFHFRSFHMYGIICSAIAVGLISVQLIKRNKTRALNGEEIKIVNKDMNKGTVIGGLMFGCGWALTGACPGPLYALIGSGYTVVIVALLSAVLGTFVYGCIKNRLPH